MNSIYDARFVHPATHLCVGPPSSGKTYKMARIIENVDKLFREKDYSSARINNVVFCYAAWQPTYEQLEQDGMVSKWINKMPTLEEFIEVTEPYKLRGGSIVVIDDFMSQLNEDLVSMVTVHAKHQNTSLFVLYQSLFPASPLARQISLNVKYIHAHKNPRENAQFSTLARQILPHDNKWLVEAYHEATKNPFSALLIDLMQDTPELMRFRSQIMPHENPMIVWVKKGSVKKGSVI